MLYPITEMPHSQPVTRLKASDNPPEKAPPFPGLWSRDNEQGSTMSKTEFYQDITNQWLEVVKDKPAYSNTYIADKAKVLSLHIQSKRDKITHAQCKQFITRSELRLQELESLEEQEQLEKDVQDEQVQQDSSEGEEAMEIDVTEHTENQSDDFSNEEGEDEAMKKRVEKELSLTKFLENSNEYIFKRKICRITLVLGFNPEYSSKFKERREEFAQKICENKTNYELFESDQKVNEHVKKSAIYKERQKGYTDIYFQDHFEGQSSQNILALISQTPKLVVDSEVFKERISHLSKKEKSEKVAMKSVKDTVKALSENPSKEGKEQRKLIGASLASLRFGVPDIGLSVKEERQAVEMKRKLLAGEENILKAEGLAARQKFPPQVGVVMCTEGQ